VLVSGYCNAGSGWACNEYGILVQPALRPDVAARAFTRACELGFVAACGNLEANLGDPPRRGPPEDRDYRIVLRGRKGSIDGLAPLALYQRACTQGFLDGCRAACAAGDARACGLEARPP
jgi:hypothetical protein